MTKEGMKATTLTYMLTGIILLVVVAIIVANWQLQKMLTAEIVATNTLKQEAQESGSNLSKAKALETYMAQHQTDVERAASIVAQSQTYQYQNQIIEDITHYANSAGLTVLEFNFPTSVSSNSSTKSSSLKSITVEVSLAKPVQYTQILTFLKLIEQNLTKMQVTDIGISPNDENPSLVESPTVGLEVYIQ